MTERKVINKYYPPDYDPSKIPKLKHREKEKNRLWSIRVMAPFNMRCNTCAEYIYKGKKFNSRKETVEDEDYLGLQIHRFYIRCPRCVAVIAFKTDPQNCDYTLEAGASRNFEAAKTAEAMERAAQKAREEEEANNPMKVLENRTKQSRLEMENIEILEELRDTNAKHAKVDHEKLICDIRTSAELQRKRQEELEEAEVKEILGKSQASIKRLYDIELDSSSEEGDDRVSSGPARQKKRTADRAAAAEQQQALSQSSRGGPPAATALPAASHAHSNSTTLTSSKAARFGIVLKKTLARASSDKSATASLDNKPEDNDRPTESHRNTPLQPRSDDWPTVEQQSEAMVGNAASAEPCPAANQTTGHSTKPRVLLVGEYSDSGSSSDD